MTDTKLPKGWDEERIQRGEHYESQTDEEARAEHDAAHRSTKYTFMAVPVELVPAVRELIATQRAG